MKITKILVAVLLFSGIACMGIRIANAQNSSDMPHLQKNGNAFRLMVDRKPFLVLGGELGNSSSSNTAYMDSLWPVLEKLHLNTLLAPVYWELVEPEEGKYDFSLVNDLIVSARQRGIRLVLLWFGSWKNSMSCYAPGWVKEDFKRFPRARDINGKPVEILSPFFKSNLDADKKAFVQLMKFVKKVDSDHHTVIMVQVENEIGMLPDARDHSPVANRAFESGVPGELMRYLKKNREELMPEFRLAWEKAGAKTSGDWQEVFGKGIATEELFMAWYFGQYVEEIATAGKDAYPLPMFVNAALNRPNRLPGQYPSAGPLPHLMDVWRAAAPSLDFLAPDIYFSDFARWVTLYDRGGNAVFLPEVRYESFSGPESYEPACGPKAFYAVGNHNAMGFSPFFIESTSGQVKGPITGTYKVLEQLAPLILEHQGTPSIKGFLFNKQHPSDTVMLGGFRIVAKHDFTLGWSAQARDDTWPVTGGLIICTGEGEYIVAGEGMVLTFPPVNDRTVVGIESIDEGTFGKGIWRPLRRLNGDQTHQGRHLRIPEGEPEIQRLKLYKYE